MHLEYLIFDASEEESGACSFDAMASVPAQRLPALVREVEAVLAWSVHTFGLPDASGEWDFDLQALAEPGGPLAITFDAGSAKVHIACTTPGRVTLTLTLGGSPGFSEAFREAFPDAD